MSNFNGAGTSIESVLFKGRVRGALGEITGGIQSEPGSPDWMNTVSSTIKDIVTQYNQQKILDANIERARQGLPPINTASIAPTYNVGLSPETQQLLMFGGIALLAILLLKRR